MAKKFVAPENLQDLDAAALEAAVNEAFDTYNELKPKDGESPSDEQIEELRVIKDFVAAAKAENSGRIAADEARKQELAAIEAEMSEGLEAPAADEDEEIAPDADEVTPDVDAPAEEDELAGAEAGELVTASKKAPANFTRRSFAATAAKNARPSQAPTAKSEGAKLVAALPHRL